MIKYILLVWWFSICRKKTAVLTLASRTFGLSIGDKISNRCVFCKSVHTFTVVAEMSIDVWDTTSDVKCASGMRSSMKVNNEGNQRWTMSAISAYEHGADCWVSQPDLNLSEAVQWLQWVRYGDVTENNISDFTRGWRGQTNDQ